MGVVPSCESGAQLDMQQQVLNVNLNDRARFSNFYVSEKNQQLVHYLQECREPLIYIWGKKGSGRTHLLQACCHEAPHSIYLPMGHYQELDPGVLDGIETIPVVCIDDVEAISQDAVWLEALFKAYNSAIDNQTSLIVTSELPPLQLDLKLADLQSRLASGVTFHMQGLTDDEKLLALQKRAHFRGFDLSDEVANYLLTHYSRSSHTLFAVLDKLERESLALQRRITIPFLKTIL